MTLLNETELTPDEAVDKINPLDPILLRFWRESGLFLDNLRKSDSWPGVERLLEPAYKSIKNGRPINPLDISKNMESFASPDDLFNVHGFLLILQTIVKLTDIRHEGACDLHQLAAVVDLSFWAGTASQHHHAAPLIKKELEDQSPSLELAKRITKVWDNFGRNSHNKTQEARNDRNLKIQTRIDELCLIKGMSYKSARTRAGIEFSLHPDHLKNFTKNPRSK